LRAKQEKRLQAFLDGELGEAAAHRIHRRVERSPVLRVELDGLRRVGDAVRASESSRLLGEVDVWDRVAMRLPAIDAEIAEGSDRRWSSRRLVPGLAAGAVAVLAAVIVAMGIYSSDASESNVVHWLDTHGQPVLVLDGEHDTIIWLLDPMIEDVSGGGNHVVG
jgi:anti-sigma factor RsiW